MCYKRTAPALSIGQTHDQHAADSRIVVAGRATVKKGRRYRGGELLDAHCAEVAASAAAAATKADKAAALGGEEVKDAQEKEEQLKQRVRATCRLYTTRTHRGGAGWSACPSGSFRVGPNCLELGDGKPLMGAHGVVCLDCIKGRKARSETSHFL